MKLLPQLPPPPATSRSMQIFDDRGLAAITLSYLAAGVLHVRSMRHGWPAVLLRFLCRRAELVSAGMLRFLQ